MADSEVKGKVGATPGKLLLIAVLAVVFVSVVVFQITAREGPPAPEENPDVSGRLDTRLMENGERRPTSPPGSGDVLKPARQWPKIALEEVLQHDPFSPPVALVPPAQPSPATASRAIPDKARRQELQRQREQALANIRSQGVKMVFMGNEERVAIIGDYRLRIGDTFEGFRVTDIGSDGVTLSEQN